MYRIWCAVLMAVSLAGSSAAFAAEGIPAIELPAGLRPYADDGKVIAGAKEIIGLFDKVEFDAPPADSPFAKAPCNDEQTGSFYRGVTLVQAGYFMVINKIERGFVSVESPNLKLLEDRRLVPQTQFGALVRPGREMLVSVWTPGRIKELVGLVSQFRQLPANVKMDLAAYFSELLVFSDRYAALKRRAADDLAELNERSEPDYTYKRDQKIADAKAKGGWEAQAADAIPKHVFYEDYSSEMRKLLDANRDVGQSKVDVCLDGGHFAAVHIGPQGEITYDPYGLYPTSYMIGFWQRRQFEGTTALAKFVLGRLIAELKAR